MGREGQKEEVAQTRGKEASRDDREGEQRGTGEGIYLLIYCLYIFFKGREGGRIEMTKKCTENM